MPVNNHQTALHSSIDVDSLLLPPSRPSNIPAHPLLLPQFQYLLALVLLILDRRTWLTLNGVRSKLVCATSSFYIDLYPTTENLYRQLKDFLTSRRIQTERSKKSGLAMLRLLARRRRPRLRFPLRHFTSQPTLEPSHHQSLPLKDPSPNHAIIRNTPVPAPSPIPSSPLRSLPFYAIAGTLVSAAALAAYVASSFLDRPSPRSDRIYADLEETLERSKVSVLRVVDRMRLTGAAATVLWKSLSSVLSSANHEVRSGFELRVAALLADISAANEARRAAIVGAGGGAVVDWLLESVASSGHGGDRSGTQSESARALAHLIADPNVCQAVLGRPHAIPNLLRFIFSFQPKKSKVS